MLLPEADSNDRQYSRYSSEPEEHHCTRCGLAIDEPGLCEVCLGEDEIKDSGKDKTMFEKVRLEFLIDESRNDVSEVLEKVRRFLINKQLSPSVMKSYQGTVISLKEAVKDWGVDEDWKEAEDIEDV